MPIQLEGMAPQKDNSLTPPTPPLPTGVRNLSDQAPGCSLHDLATFSQMSHKTECSMKSNPLPDKPLASQIPVHCAFDALADVVSLTPNPRNTNKHPDKQVALLAKVIRHQGWRAPIVVSKRSGFVVAGHGRLQAAALLQVEKVPVNFQDFATEADEHAHMIADNRIAELAETDEATLAGLLSEMRSQDVDLDLTGYQGEDVNELLAKLTVEEPPAEPTRRTEPGEKFLILVTCSSELDRASKLMRLQEDGILCEPVEPLTGRAAKLIRVRGC